MLWSDLSEKQKIKFLIQIIIKKLIFGTILEHAPIALMVLKLAISF